MTEEFKQFLRAWMYPHECEYAKGHYGDLNYVIAEDVSGDPGGVTKWGIDYGAHKSLGTKGIKALTIDQADAIYWHEFEDSPASKLSNPMSYCYFDCEINAGRGRAEQFRKITKTAKEFCDERAAWYGRLAKAKPSSAKFLKGWLARVNDLRRYLKIK